MNHEALEIEGMLSLALSAMQQGRDADAVALLEALLERDPRHVHGRYLLAAQHAQMGLFERAEIGFRAVVADAPGFTIAEFQLGQLLLVRGARDEAAGLLGRLAGQVDALGAYARALLSEDPGEAVDELTTGLALPQAIPALAADMQRLRSQLLSSSLPAGDTPPPAAPPPSMFLTGYGQG